MTFVRSHIWGMIVLCAAFIAPYAAAAQPATMEEMPALKKYFDEVNADGTIIVHDLKKDTTVVYNAARAHQDFVPASTFKIMNSLVALQTGVVKDTDKEIFKYSGTPFLVDGKPFLPKQCEADITMRTAFQLSCIPVYQEIANRVGMDRYRKILSEIGYGTVDALKSERVDWFWLEGNYKVSADRQIAFLQSLYRGNLSFSPHVIEQVKDIMLSENGPDYVIRAKTGYLFSSRPVLGWYVGWIERGDGVHVFALNMDMARPAEQAKARVSITKAVLKELGAL